MKNEKKSRYNGIWEVIKRQDTKLTLKRINKLNLPEDYACIMCNIHIYKDFDDLFIKKDMLCSDCELETKYVKIVYKKGKQYFNFKFELKVSKKTTTNNVGVLK